MNPSNKHQMPRTERQAATTRLLRLAHYDQAVDGSGQSPGRADNRPDAVGQQALDEAIVVNMQVARALASRHKDRGIPLEDLEQVAHLALVRAARQFDPSRERDFLAYAVPTIRGELRKHFRDRGWMVRPPREVQELQTKVIAARDNLAEHDGHIPTAREIADHLGEAVAVVRECLLAQGCFHPTSLDLPLGGNSPTTLGEQLGQNDGSMEAAEARVMLRDALRHLSPRDGKIVRMRFFEDCTQQEIADAIGVTQMQVSRLLSRILRDLRRLLGPAPKPAA